MTISYPKLILPLTTLFLFTVLIPSAWSDKSNRLQIPPRTKKLLQASSAMLNAEYTKAILIFNSILENNPDDSETLAKLGWAKIKNGDVHAGVADVSKAIDQLTQAIAKEPENGRLYYLRGSAFRWVQQYEQAEADLKKAVEYSPNRSNYPNDLKAIQAEAKSFQQQRPESENN